jgi:hypothetical protein
MSTSVVPSGPCRLELPTVDIDGTSVGALHWEVGRFFGVALTAERIAFFDQWSGSDPLLGEYRDILPWTEVKEFTGTLVHYDGFVLNASDDQ